LHYQRRDTEIGGYIFNRSSFGHQRREGFKLVCGVHGFALDVLGQAGGAGGCIGNQQARDFQSFGNAAFLCQQFEGCQSATTCYDFVMLAVLGKNHGQILQQADTGNARGQCIYRLPCAFTDVAARRARYQLRQGNQNQVFGRVGSFQCDVTGFGLDCGFHDKHSICDKNNCGKMEGLN